MDFGRFNANRKRFGRCASWAVWDQGACEHLRFQPAPEAAPKMFLNSAVTKLGAITSQADLDNLGWKLNNNIALVAMNFGQRPQEEQDAVAGIDFFAFHEETTTTSDQRLRGACCGTPLWGCYITDLVKFNDAGALAPLRDSSSANMKKLLANHDFVAIQISGLIEELRELGAHNPTIVALGNDVHRALTRPTSAALLSSGLGHNTRIIKITHYSKAAGIRHSDYVGRVLGELLASGLFLPQTRKPPA